MSLTPILAAVLGLAVAQPASAEINPCRAFGFFMKTSGWKADFQQVMGFYQKRLEASAETSAEGHYQKIIDRILECYNEKANSTGGSSVAENTPSDPYDLLEFKLHAYPRGLHRAPVYQAGKQPVFKGVSRQDLEDLKAYHPQLEEFFDQASPVAKRYTTETDVALSALLDFFKTEYPKSQWVKDRKLWTAFFQSNFESEVMRVAPEKAFQKALHATESEFAGELSDLREKFDQTLSAYPELNSFFDRKDLFSYFFLERFFRATLLKAAWEEWGRSYPLIRKDADAIEHWSDWTESLLQEDSDLLNRLRNGDSAFHDPVSDRIIQFRRQHPTPSSSVITDVGGHGLLNDRETEPFVDLEISRSRVTVVSVDHRQALHDFMNPNFENCVDLEEITHALQVYSAICAEFPEVKSAVEKTESANLLDALEHSEYAQKSGKSGLTIATEVAAELGQEFDRSIKTQAGHAAAYRKLLQGAVQKLGADPETVQKTASLFAEAYPAREQIDVFRFDEFFARQLTKVKQTLGPGPLKEFMRNYRDERLSSCSNLLHPFRALKALFKKAP